LDEHIEEKGTNSFEFKDAKKILVSKVKQSLYKPGEALRVPEG
jgi:hypothetical protein